ncbi:hypothetical protein [Streptomyces sp. NRRL F-5123]|uniref:hypothetical protein n=1 Tax=Streptomyces sp. NRRL F-5123 TaxID=1463856 RepID=UPI000AA3216A|nr:hypothetical protein [Streptomyces sp. NRRL F-5123]
MIPDLSPRQAFLIVAVATGVMSALTLTAHLIGAGPLLLCLMAAASPAQLARS